MPTVFERIINREIPGKIFYEDDLVFVFADHRPQDQVHLLIAPKKVYTSFYQTPSEVLELLFSTAKKVADMLGINNHFRLVINNGYRQEVDHVHVHFLSNRGKERLTWLE